MTTIDIPFAGLVAGLLLFVAPVYILYLLQVDVWRKTLRAALQMTAGLTVAALLARAALIYSNIMVTLLCLIIFTGITAAYMVSKARIRQKKYIVPVAAGILLTVVPLTVYFLFAVSGIWQVFHPQCFIPVAALLIGGMAEANIKALGTYYDGLRHHTRLYYYLIGNGATHAESIRYFTRRALKRSVTPMLQRMGVMTVGTAPVTLWVMIFCGVDTNTALIIQIMLVGLLVSATTCSLIATLWIARRYAFDAYDNIAPTRGAIDNRPAGAEIEDAQQKNGETADYME